MIRDGIRRAFDLALRRTDRWEREVEEEIKLHLSHRAEQLMSTGLTADQAYDEAVRRFGPLAESRKRLLDAARHREKRMQRTEHFSDLRQDFAFAVRTLARDKGWTAVTVLTLALGIGATTAVFSVVSSVLIHAVPYPHADRVVVVFQQPSEGNNTGINVSILPGNASIRAWKGANSFEALEGISGDQTAELRTSGEPATVHVSRIEPTFPRFAGVHPIAGRVFTPSEILARERVAVLGESMWRTRFAADTAILGKPITLDDSTYTIVGVLPATLQTPRVGGPPTDVWLPLDLRGDEGGASVVGRLRPGANAAQAERELDSLYARQVGQESVAERVAGGARNAAGIKLPFRAVASTPARQVQFRASLILLGWAVGLVLLVACTNVAHLLMARSMSRRRELAIRVALGAGRGRVFRQLLTESLLLAAMGSALGVAGGWAGLKGMLALRPIALSALRVARVDSTTLGIALAVTLLTSVVFGLMGAVQSSRSSTHDELKSGGSRSATTGHGRVRQLLVVTEMALSAMLVVGATMLVRSVINLQNADLGFEPKGLYTLNLEAPKGHFANAAARGELVRDVATRLTGVTGVRSVAPAKTPPTWFTFIIGRLEIEGHSTPPSSTTAFVNANQIESGYFQTMGIHLVAGTTFSDTTRGSREVIVNERFARKQWPGISPLGRRLRVAESDTTPWLSVVGVARDAATGGPVMHGSAEPLLYRPAADSEVSWLLLRTEGSADLLKPVQALVHSLDPAVTPKLQSVEVQMAESISVPRFVMLLLSTFTVLALALAAIGLYGVMAYMVAQRTREIGIRVALGASRTRIARSVIAGGVTLAVAGCIVGVVVAVWGTKLIETQLYGVARSDVASFGAAAVVLLGAAVAACVVPARRALAVDPMTAIRAD